MTYERKCITIQNVYQRKCVDNEIANGTNIPITQYKHLFPSRDADRGIDVD